MLEELPEDVHKNAYGKEMDSFEKTGLINFIEELWRVFAELLDMCYNKNSTKPK